jgi:phosphatidylserine decarboxylase
MPEKRWPIVREGFPFILIAALLAVFFGLIGWKVLLYLFILLTLYIAWFFRNPKRKIPNLENVVLAPADGRIVHLGECDEDRFLHERRLKISIFMSLFDVHINRAPVPGKIVQRKYNPGRFFAANVEKASLLNEQNALLFETEDRVKILLIQIAGFVARRIVCYAKEGSLLKKGEIFGLIRFGSRIDLYLPTDVKPTVRMGQHVKAGESVMGVRS